MTSFSLANALLLFQSFINKSFINNILYKILDKFCTTYIDDILIYSNSKKEYQTYVQKVFATLQKARL